MQYEAPPPHMWYYPYAPHAQYAGYGYGPHPLSAREPEPSMSEILSFSEVVHGKTDRWNTESRDQFQYVAPTSAVPVAYGVPGGYGGQAAYSAAPGAYGYGPPGHASNHPQQQASTTASSRAKVRSRSTSPRGDRGVQQEMPMRSVSPLPGAASPRGRAGGHDAPADADFNATGSRSGSVSRPASASARMGRLSLTSSTLPIDERPPWRIPGSVSKKCGKKAREDRAEIEERQKALREVRAFCVSRSCLSCLPPGCNAALVSLPRQRAPRPCCTASFAIALPHSMLCGLARKDKGSSARCLRRLRTLCVHAARTPHARLHAPRARCASRRTRAQASFESRRAHSAARARPRTSDQHAVRFAPGTAAAAQHGGAQPAPATTTASMRAAQAGLPSYDPSVYATSPAERRLSTTADEDAAMQQQQQQRHQIDQQQMEQQQMAQQRMEQQYQQPVALGYGSWPPSAQAAPAGAVALQFHSFQPVQMAQLDPRTYRGLPASAMWPIPAAGVRTRRLDNWLR